MLNASEVLHLTFEHPAPQVDFGVAARERPLRSAAGIGGGGSAIKMLEIC